MSKDELILAKDIDRANSLILPITRVGIILGSGVETRIGLINKNDLAFSAVIKYGIRLVRCSSLYDSMCQEKKKQL